MGLFEPKHPGTDKQRLHHQKGVICMGLPPENRTLQTKFRGWLIVCLSLTRWAGLLAEQGRRCGPPEEGSSPEKAKEAHFTQTGHKEKEGKNKIMKISCLTSLNFNKSLQILFYSALLI